MLKQINKKDRGFTIIEVMIVLAIAGLIMLIVFLAVPSLQRNQRNTSRKNDASRMGAAITTYVANNNGTVPADTVAAEDAIRTEAGNLAQYTLSSGAVAANVMTAGQFNIVAGAVGSVTQVTNDAMLLSTGAQCDTANPGQTVAGSSRQMALLYTLEPGNGANYTQVCQNL